MSLYMQFTINNNFKFNKNFQAGANLSISVCIHSDDADETQSLMLVGSVQGGRKEIFETASEYVNDLLSEDLELRHYGIANLGMARQEKYHIPELGQILNPNAWVHEDTFHPLLFNLSVNAGIMPVQNPQNAWGMAAHIQGFYNLQSGRFSVFKGMRVEKDVLPEWTKNLVQNWALKGMVSFAQKTSYSLVALE